MCQVFSASLPKQFQDDDVAEECITAAIEISPTCSKANHRMGIFQWTKVRSYFMDHPLYIQCFHNKIIISQRDDFENALEYLTTAIRYKNENYYAIIDYIELLIHDAEEKSDILNEIFEEILSKNFSWTRDERAHLIFLKGCFIFIIRGKKKDTMDCWIEAYKLCFAFHFQQVFGQASRFRWKAFEKSEILNLLTNSKRNFYKSVQKMICEVRKSIAKDVEKTSEWKLFCNYSALYIPIIVFFSSNIFTKWQSVQSQCLCFFMEVIPSKCRLTQVSFNQAMAQYNATELF